MEPLFPRLHVKDTENGGPKPPPRNKMAVYQELTTPSSMFIDGSKPIFPLHPNGIRHAGFSGQVEKRTLFASNGAPALTHKTPGLVPSSQSAGILSYISANSAVKPLGYDTSSISGNSLMSIRTNSFHRAKQLGIGQEKKNSPAMNSLIQFQQTSNEHRLTRACLEQDPENDAKLSASSVQISSKKCRGSTKKMPVVSTVGENVSSHESSKLLLHSRVPKSSKNVPSCSSQHSNQPENKVTLKDSATDQANLLGDNHLSLLRTDSYSGPMIADNSQCVEESENKIVQAGVVGRNEDASGTTEVDNATSVIISPDNVVQKTGHENFWKIRRILVDQQRIFSIQVFELHRLVQVQKSLAGSSQHFREDDLCLHKRFPPILHDSARGPLCGKTRSSSMVMSNKAVTSFNSHRNSLCDHHSTISTACFYPPPEKQWMIPNAAGFTAHLFRSFGPMNVSPDGGSYFLKAAYGIPAATQQGKGVVPGIPITMSYCDFEEHAVVEDMSSYFPCFSSHQKPDDVAHQCSTGSCSVEKSSKDVLPLFPFAVDSKTRAIKVLPRDGRLASESAMRIFHSIQEERKQNEMRNLRKPSDEPLLPFSYQDY